MNSIDFKIKNLAEIFDGKIIGDEKLIINGVSSICLLYTSDAADE